ncbi:HxsD-like protein [Candidatus Woesearchaeota archaeon]|nr:HxsD-like protein [Candidatus Woesearchaeota archaeon]
MEKIKVDRQGNRVSVRFNPFFYDGKYIVRAIEDYSSACDISAEDGVIILKPKENISLDILGYEFYNYVLGLMKNT